MGKFTIMVAARRYAGIAPEGHHAHLSAGQNARQAYYMALWSTWDGEPSQAKAALAELRVLVPKLAPADATEARSWLDEYKVDLLEGNVEAAIAASALHQR